MSNKDNIILKMGESYEPNWAISASGNSMYIEVQHENTIGVLPSDALINDFVSNLVKLQKSCKLQKKIHDPSKRQIC